MRIVYGLVFFFALAASSAHADSIFSGSASVTITPQGASSETTDWTFNVALANGSDPTFTIVHAFTGVTVFPWGGWQINGTDTVNVAGDFPAQLKGWLPQIESFTDTPIPSPSLWDVTLFHGVKGDACKFCSDWSLPTTSTPEPGTLALLGAGLMALAWVRRRRT